MKKQKMLLAKKSRENINWIEKVKDNIIFQKELEFYWKLKKDLNMKKNQINSIELSQISPLSDH
jgi:hypothetical protein